MSVKTAETVINIIFIIFTLPTAFTRRSLRLIAVPGEMCFGVAIPLAGDGTRHRVV